MNHPQGSLACGGRGGKGKGGEKGKRKVRDAVENKA